MSERITGNANHLRSYFVKPERRERNQFFSLWTTPESMADYVASINQSDCWYHGAWDNSASFRASRDMPHAVAMCRDGWPEGAERAARLRDKINAAHPIGPRLVRWDIAGAYPGVARALAGNPMHMRRIDSARLRRKPVLTLMSDHCVSASVNAEWLINRAAVVAAIIDAIEASGFACEVISFDAVTDQRSTQCTRAVVIKESDQIADIGRMAFALGHAAYFRRLMFALASSDRFNAPLGSGLGWPMRYDFSGRDDVYLLPATNENFSNENTASTHGLASLIASLQKQGCPAFPQDVAA